MLAVILRDFVIDLLALVLDVNEILALMLDVMLLEAVKDVLLLTLGVTLRDFVIDRLALLLDDDAADLELDKLEEALALTTWT